MVMHARVFVTSRRRLRSPSLMNWAAQHHSQASTHVMQARPRPSHLEEDPTAGHFRVSRSLLKTLSAREYKTSMTSMGVYETKRTKRYADRKYKWTEADVIEDLLTVMSPYFYTRSHTSTRSRKRRRCSTYGAKDFNRRILIYESQRRVIHRIQCRAENIDAPLYINITVSSRLLFQTSSCGL